MDVHRLRRDVHHRLHAACRVCHTAYDNVYFRIKYRDGAGRVNALVYHRYTERRIVEWDDRRSPPTRRAIAGLVSICVWCAVIVAGRMMSYTMF